MSETKLGEQRVIQYKARDGREVEGPLPPLDISNKYGLKIEK